MDFEQIAPRNDESQVSVISPESTNENSQLKISSEMPFHNLEAEETMEKEQERTSALETKRCNIQQTNIPTKNETTTIRNSSDSDKKASKSAISNAKRFIGLPQRRIPKNMLKDTISCSENLHTPLSLISIHSVDIKNKIPVISSPKRSLTKYEGELTPRKGRSITELKLLENRYKLKKLKYEKEFAMHQAQEKAMLRMYSELKSISKNIRDFGGKIVTKEQEIIAPVTYKLKEEENIKINYPCRIITTILLNRWKEIDKVKEELSITKARLDNIELDNSELNEEESTTSELRAKLSVMELAHGVSLEEIDYMNKQNIRLTEENQKLNRENEQLQLKIDDLVRNDFEKINAMPDNDYDSLNEIARVKGETKVLLKEISVLREEKSIVEHKYEALLSEIAFLNKENKAWMSANSVLNEERSSIEQKYEALQSKIARLDEEKKIIIAENSSLTEEKSSLKNKCETLDSEMARLSKENETLMTENSLLTENKLSTERKYETLRSKVARLDKENKKLKAENSELTEENSTTQLKCEELRSKISRLNEESKVLKAENSALTEEKSGREHKYDAMRSIIARLEEEKKTLETANSTLTEEKSRLEQKYESSVLELARINKENDSLMAENSTSNEEKTRMKQLLAKIMTSELENDQTKRIPNICLLSEDQREIEEELQNKLHSLTSLENILALREERLLQQSQLISVRKGLLKMLRGRERSNKMRRGDMALEAMTELYEDSNARVKELERKLRKKERH